MPEKIIFFADYTHYTQGLAITWSFSSYDLVCFSAGDGISLIVSKIAQRSVKKTLEMGRVPEKIPSFCPAVITQLLLT